MMVPDDEIEEGLQEPKAAQEMQEISIPEQPENHKKT